MAHTSDQDLVAAQNRTTHAVRALGVYVLYAALADLIGGVIIGITYASSGGYMDSTESAGLVFGFAVLAIGNLIALFAGLGELSRSKINVAVTKNAAVTEESSSSTAGLGQVACRSCSTINSESANRCSKCDAWLK